LERWRIGLGATYFGESTSLDATENSGNSDYLWTLNIQSNLLYDIPKIKSTLSAQLKYTGRAQTIISSSDGEVALGQTDAFTWLDASARTTLTKNLDLTFGARNILDIVTVNATDVPSGSHGTVNANSRLFGNGRSYFLKLSYLLTLK
jgi:outer membrane receptor for ferrienterochelin and colicins